MSLLRLRFAFGMALIATLGNFIPYVGLAIVSIINFFIALYQGTTIFGLAAFPYALIVTGIGWISDIIYDTAVSTRIMANVLKLPSRCSSCGNSYRTEPLRIDWHASGSASTCFYYCAISILREKIA